MQSPPKPWEPGKHPTYTSFKLVVNICQDEFGNVWSHHDFLTSEDAGFCVGLAHGGVAQVAHALLTEAVRREAFTCALIWMGKEPEFLARWVAAPPEEQRFLETELVKTAQHVLTATAGKMLPGAVAGVLAMLVQQGGEPPVPSE